MMNHKRKHIESDGNGGYWISKATMWAFLGIVLVVVGSVFAMFARFVTAENEIHTLQVQQAAMEPKIDELEKNVAVTQDHIVSIDKGITAINKKLDAMQMPRFP